MNILCDEKGRLITLPVVERGERRNGFVLAEDLTVGVNIAFVNSTTETQPVIVRQMMQGYDKKIPQKSYDYMQARILDLLNTLNSEQFNVVATQQYGKEIKNGVAFSATLTHRSTNLRIRNRVCKDATTIKLFNSAPNLIPRAEIQKIASSLVTKEKGSRPKNHRLDYKRFVGFFNVARQIKEKIDILQQQEKKIAKILKG